MTARDRTMLIVLAIAGLAAAGWFLVLAPMREDASELSSQLLTARQTRDSALADVAAGVAARRDYARDYATVARLGAAVPEDDNVASLLVQIEHAADVSAVDFRSLRAGGGSAAAAAAAVAPAAAAPATQAATATLPPGASVGAAGFPTMPFSFSFAGDFFRLSDFVGRLERFLVVDRDALGVGGRFVAIDGIGLNAAPAGFPRMQASVAATTYLLPSLQGLTDGATAAGPAGSDPATSSGTPPSSGETASKGLPAAPAIVTPGLR